MPKITELPIHIDGQEDVEADLLAVVENGETRQITLEQLRQQIDAPIYVHSAIPNIATTGQGTPETLYTVTVPAGVFEPGDVIWVFSTWFPAPTDHAGVGMNTYGIFRDAGGDANNPFHNIDIDGSEKLLRRSPVELTSDTAQQFPPANDPFPIGIVTGSYGLALNCDTSGEFFIDFRGTSDGVNNVALHQVFVQGFKST